MPKRVDAEARRGELAAAMWRVFARDGIGGATIRSVASEAGWTRGVVEHYFPNKQQMLSYACQTAGERLMADVRKTHARLVGRAALRQILLQDLVLAGGREETVSIWLSLASAAYRDGDIAAGLGRFESDLRAIVIEIIAEMIERGEASPEIDRDRKARFVVPFSFGMALAVAMQPERRPNGTIEADIEDFLDCFRRAGPAATEALEPAASSVGRSSREKAAFGADVDAG